MGSILWGFHLYFAAVLGVSGLAKIDNHAFFASTLRRQRLLPGWSVGGINTFFPWCEVLIAFLLVLSPGQGAAFLLGACVLLLFGMFLGIETILLTRKQEVSTCGCYGAAHQRKVSKSSLVTSALLLVLAGCQFWLTTWMVQPNWIEQVVGCALFCGVGGWFTWRMVQRHHAGKQAESQRQQEFSRPPSQEGKQLLFSYES